MIGPRHRYRPAARTIAAAVLGAAVPLAAQSPRAANPERPTVATHAYAVAPGYAELEQGLRRTAETTTWEFNLKLGLAPGVQLGVFGVGFGHTRVGSGIGDVGLALKLRRDLSPHAAAAIIPSVSLPTGSATLALGAGRALGNLVGVLSADLSPGVHVDANAGAMGIGAGSLQALATTSVSARVGRWIPAVELYGVGAGAAGPRVAGLLGAVSLTAAPWLVFDGGGVIGLGGSPDQAFLGATTNLGRLF